MPQEAAVKLSSDAERIAKRLVPKFVRFERKMVSREDALQIARLAAWNACETYDPKQGGNINSRIVFKVKEALLEMMRSRNYDAPQSRNGVPYVSTVSFSEPLVNDGNEEFVGDTLGYTPDLGEVPQQEEMVDYCFSLISPLPPRERAVMIWRYYDDLTLPEIARRLGVSDGRASQLHQQGLKRIKSAL